MSTLESRRTPNLAVILAGFATSFAGLALIYVSGVGGGHLMGFYLAHIIPVGALLVGIVSGSGYGLGSRVLNVRIGKPFLYTVAVISVAVYFAAEYLTFLHVLQEHGISSSKVSFVRYYRYLCEHMTYSRLAPGSIDQGGVQLGKLGYCLKALEASGFCLGAIVPLLVLRSRPYCPACMTYMRKEGVYYTAGTGLRADLKKKPRKEKSALTEAASREATEENDTTLSRIVTTGFEDTHRALQLLDTMAPKKTLAYVRNELRKCPTCENHSIHAVLHFTKLDGHAGYKTLAKVSKTPNVGEMGEGATVWQDGAQG